MSQKKLLRYLPISAGGDTLEAKLIAFRFTIFDDRTANLARPDHGFKQHTRSVYQPYRIRTTNVAPHLSRH